MPYIEVLRLREQAAEASKAGHQPVRMFDIEPEPPCSGLRGQSGREESMRHAVLEAMVVHALGIEATVWREYRAVTLTGLVDMPSLFWHCWQDDEGVARNPGRAGAVGRWTRDAVVSGGLRYADLQRLADARDADTYREARRHCTKAIFPSHDSDFLAEYLGPWLMALLQAWDGLGPVWVEDAAVAALARSSSRWDRFVVAGDRRLVRVTEAAGALLADPDETIQQVTRAALEDNPQDWPLRL